MGSRTRDNLVGKELIEQNTHNHPPRSPVLLCRNARQRGHGDASSDFFFGHVEMRCPTGPTAPCALLGRSATRCASRRRPPRRPPATGPGATPRPAVACGSGRQRADRAPAAHGRSRAPRGRAIIARARGLRGARVRVYERVVSAHRAAVRVQAQARRRRSQGQCVGGC